MMRSALNMHLKPLYHYSKMCLEYQGIIFNAKTPKIFTNAYSQARPAGGVDSPLPPLPDRKISGSFFDDFP